MFYISGKVNDIICDEIDQMASCILLTVHSRSNTGVVCFRVMSSLQVTHLTPVWDILLHLEYTPDIKDQRLIEYHLKDTGNGELIYTCFEAAPLD